MIDTGTLATGLALQGNGGVINISSSTSPSDQYIVRGKYCKKRTRTVSVPSGRTNIASLTNL
jgi:hypothetical protein